MEDSYQANKTKMSSACCEIRLMYHFGNINTLKVIYFVCVHLRMKYGIIFWGNFMDSKRVFQLQKRVVRIMKGQNPALYVNLYSEHWKY